MESIKTVMDWEIISDNSLIMWIVYGLSFILALIMMRTKDKIRRKAGIVLLIESVPGLLIALFCFGLFVYIFFYLLMITDPVTHQLNDLKLMRNYYELDNTPITFLCLSIFLFPLNALFQIITGAIVIKKCKNCKSGYVSLIFGILLIIGSILFTLALLAGLGTT